MKLIYIYSYNMYVLLVHPMITYIFWFSDPEAIYKITTNNTLSNIVQSCKILTQISGKKVFASVKDKFR